MAEECQTLRHLDHWRRRSTHTTCVSTGASGTPTLAASAVSVRFQKRSSCPWPPSVSPSSKIGSEARISTCAWAHAHRSRGSLDAALDLTRSALDLCVAQGDRHREAALRNNLADVLHDAGRPEDAMEQLKLAVAIFADVGEGEPQPGVWKLARW